MWHEHVCGGGGVEQGEQCVIVCVIVCVSVPLSIVFAMFSLFAECIRLYFSLAHLDSLECILGLGVHVIAEHERLLHQVVLVTLDGRGVRHLDELELFVHDGVDLLVASVLSVEGEDGVSNVGEDG